MLHRWSKNQSQSPSARGAAAPWASWMPNYSLATPNSADSLTNRQVSELDTLWRATMQTQSGTRWSVLKRKNVTSGDFGGGSRALRRVV
jgi:hypothetical protein